MVAAAGNTRTAATLNSEILVGLQQNVTASCNPDGTSTINYWVVGEAGALDAKGNFSANKGPYPGTFTEQGTLTMGPQAVSGISITPASVLTWTATFTIVSSAGIVTGRRPSPDRAAQASASSRPTASLRRQPGAHRLHTTTHTPPPSPAPACRGHSPTRVNPIRSCSHRIRGAARPTPSSSR